MGRKVEYKASLDNSQLMCRNICVNINQTIVEGDLLVISSGKISKAGAAASGIIGFAKSAITTGGTVTAADKVQVAIYPSRGILRVTFTPGTKTTITDADMYGTYFDIDANQKMLLDDTTGGMLAVVAYDNTAKWADVVIKESALWNV